MNKFFKSIVTVVLSSIAILATSAEAQQDKFAIKAGNYQAELINQKIGKILVHDYAELKIENNGKGVYFQPKATEFCHKGELKFSQNRNSSGQLVFEVKAKDKTCFDFLLLVTKHEDGFFTHVVTINSQGLYEKKGNGLAGNWIKSKS